MFDEYSVQSLLLPGIDYNCIRGRRGFFFGTVFLDMIQSLLTIGGCFQFICNRVMSLPLQDCQLVNDSREEVRDGTDSDFGIQTLLASLFQVRDCILDMRDFAINVLLCRSELLVQNLVGNFKGWMLYCRYIIHCCWQVNDGGKSS